MHFEVSVEDEFSAAHSIRGKKDKCEKLHGHNWKVKILVRAERLDKRGLVIDFKILKNKLRKCLKKLDHTYLNNIAYFKKNNPTSEQIAKYIYDKTAPTINTKRYKLDRVSVWESQKSEATYRE